MANQDFMDMPIELNSEGLSQEKEGELYAIAEDELRKLTKNHQDITGAAIHIKQPAKSNTDFIYDARVVAYVRPENVFASEKHNDPASALRGALDAVARQIREKRERMRQDKASPDEMFIPLDDEIDNQEA